ncbi:MAG: polymer-forming cytoskeletal protein, partial [Desulfobacterales bacterium]
AQSGTPFRIGLSVCSRGCVSHSQTNGTVTTTVTVALILFIDPKMNALYGGGPRVPTLWPDVKRSLFGRLGVLGYVGDGPGMKGPKKGIQTFLGPETSLEGKLSFEGTVRLDGHLKGSVESKEGVIVVGENALIRADIFVCTAVVFGEVKGNIRATNCIALHAPARVFGDLCAPAVVIDAGVVFHGNCSMKPGDLPSGKPIELSKRHA